jgi:hypothetical protein
MMRDWLLEVTAHRETDAFDRAIDLRITRLRRKVEIDPAHPEAIQTVRGGRLHVRPAKKLINNPDERPPLTGKPSDVVSWYYRGPERPLRVIN